MNVIPDTGAEVTIAGEMYLPMLKIKKRNLRVPTETLKHVAGGKVPVIGSCYLSFQIYGQSVIEEVYFVPNISHIFLSIGACKGLKLISPNFPYQNDLRVVDTEEQEDLKAFSFGNVEGGQRGITTELSASTSTKKGEVVWEPPSVMPYEAVEENIPLLEKWFLKTFEKVFDTEQYPLPVMTGLPHHIHLQEGAKPIAIHSPLSVPVHWKQAVKELLDRDVELGIIEKVPVGEAVE